MYGYNTVSLEDILKNYKNEVFEWIVDNYRPADVFPDDDLENWAEENGWVVDENV
jgi:hypothetical protein